MTNQIDDNHTDTVENHIVPTIDEPMDTTNGNGYSSTYAMVSTATILSTIRFN